MGIYYSIRFRGKLSDRSIRSVDDFFDFVRWKGLCLHLDTEPSEYYGVEPSFGRKMRFGGDPFGSLTGFRVADGVLEFGCSSANLTWDHYDEEPDGIQVRPDFTRLDAILAALSSLTTGVEGEIHGVIGYDQHDEPNGWPIIRCEDGVLRLAMTPSSGFDGDHRHTDMLAEVQAVLPPGFIVPSEKRYEIEIDLDRLRDRLAPLDLSPSPPGLRHF